MANTIHTVGSLLVAASNPRDTDGSRGLVFVLVFLTSHTLETIIMIFRCGSGNRSNTFETIVVVPIKLSNIGAIESFVGVKTVTVEVCTVVIESKQSNRKLFGHFVNAVLRAFIRVNDALKLSIFERL